MPDNRARIGFSFTSGLALLISKKCKKSSSSQVKVAVFLCLKSVSGLKTNVPILLSPP